MLSLGALEPGEKFVQVLIYRIDLAGVPGGRTAIIDELARSRQVILVELQPHRHIEHVLQARIAVGRIGKLRDVID